MARRGLLVGLSAALALGLAASVALAGDLFLMQVSKVKAGPYGPEAHLNVPKDKTRRAFYKINNNTPDPVEYTFTQSAAGSPKIKLSWYLGQEDITSAVKGDGYEGEIAGNSSVIIKLKAKATGNGSKCVEGVASSGDAHQLNPVSINTFCTMR